MTWVMSEQNLKRAYPHAFHSFCHVAIVLERRFGYILNTYHENTFFLVVFVLSSNLHVLVHKQIPTHLSL